MRKKFLSVVLLTGCLASLPEPATRANDNAVKIFHSLEEAVPQPARPLLLIFFSLDCHVCWEELFEMRHFLKKCSIPVDLVGICREPEEELRPFLSKFAFFDPVVSDRKKALFRKFRVRLEPFRVILAPDLSILYEDDTLKEFYLRRDEVKRWLLAIASD